MVTARAQISLSACHLPVADNYAADALSRVRLQQVIRGIKRTGTSQVAQHPRLPITPNILLTLHGVWQNSPDHSSASLLWAAACLAFFGFLRTAEFTVPSAHSLNNDLCIEDVAVDNSEHPSCLYQTVQPSRFRKICPPSRTNHIRDAVGPALDSTTSYYIYSGGVHDLGGGANRGEGGAPLCYRYRARERAMNYNGHGDIDVSSALASARRYN